MCFLIIYHQWNWLTNWSVLVILKEQWRRLARGGNVLAKILCSNNNLTIVHKFDKISTNNALKLCILVCNGYYQLMVKIFEIHYSAWCFFGMTLIRWFRNTKRLTLLKINRNINNMDKYWTHPHLISCQNPGRKMIVSSG